MNKSDVRFIKRSPNEDVMERNEVKRNYRTSEKAQLRRREEPIHNDIIQRQSYSTPSKNMPQ